VAKSGVYEDLITRALRRTLDEAESRGQLVETQKMELDWLDDALAVHVASRVQRALAAAGSGEDAVAKRAEIVARVLTLLGEVDADVVAPDDLPLPTREALTWIGPERPTLGVARPPQRPEHGLVHPSLLFNGPRDVSLVHELRREIASADAIDVVVAFLKRSGLNLIHDAIARFVERGGALRLLTTTYTGATERRAVDALVALGGQVRVVYEEDGTRLHAKAWLFRRHSGLCTAYVGSSNLSHSAMTDGAEWNVRVTRRRTPAVVERFELAFEQLWSAAGPDYAPEAHRDRLSAALARSRDGHRDDALFALIASLDVAPKPHQERALEALAAERAHGHRSNLVVAATGTGKTWISAFDYARLRGSGEVDSLLFVAHRKEILTQSRDVFRLVLKDPGFGELWVDGEQPSRGRHVFASVQSLRADVVRGLDPDAVDYLVIDEFHHAAAPSYRALLEHLTPAIRLGLTATPERMDGADVTGWFDGRVASDVRLWDALDAGLLAPFHYYGVHDPTSAEVAWRRGQLDPGALDAVYTGDHARAERILAAVGRYVSDPTSMRALGFCVGVGHAALMAAAFREKGLAAEVVHGGTPAADRHRAVQRLRSGAVRALFTVDLFNEGVDLPEVDVVLFLRPTESATVFLQQLGRGLRKHRDKAHLLVLDFVGHVHADYRYDARYRALLGGTTSELKDQIERDFPRLPSGCAITLEPQARDTVLASVRRFVGAPGARRLVEELRGLPATTTLAEFLRRTGRDVDEVFSAVGHRSWSQLRRAAGHERRPEREGEASLRSKLGRILHVDDPGRLGAWSAWLAAPTAPRLAGLDPDDAARLRMLLVDLGGGDGPVAAFQDEIDALWAHDVVREEAVALFGVLGDAVRHPIGVVRGRRPLPFGLHAAYTRREVVAALGVTAKGRLRELREGVMWVEERGLDVFFVTLEKSEDRFRPSIRYADYPITATRFHWESQNNTHDGSETGRRYVEHARRGVDVLFFIRERPEDQRGAAPFVCAGTARYVRHDGGRPMRIEWDLDHALPAALLSGARLLAS
jgi:superfamily II DNA or RNA helicase/HKD family nuclease